jgi:hypothetical protein
MPPTAYYPQAGSYNGLRLKYSEFLLDESFHRGSRISLEHSQRLPLGIHCTYNVNYPSQSLLDYPDLLAKRIVSEEADLQCKAVDKDNAFLLFQDERFLSAIEELKEFMTKVEGGGFILTDRCITFICPELFFPIDSLLRVMFNVSLAAARFSAGIRSPSKTTKLSFTVFLSYIFGLVFLLFALWILTTRF